MLTSYSDTPLYVKQERAKLEQKHGVLLEAQNLRGFIRKHHLMDTQLEELAAQFGVALVYGPQYHPEANPIERYWALLKRYYYDTDPTLPHKTRMALALAKMPEDYADKCINASLRWCWEKHEAMGKQPGFGGPASAVQDVAGLADVEDSEEDSESDHSDLEPEGRLRLKKRGWILDPSEEEEDEDSEE